MHQRRFVPLVLAALAFAALVAAARTATVGQAAPAADQTIYLPHISQGCGPTQLVADGGFEAGLPTTAWQAQSSVGSMIIDDTDPPPAHGGTWKAWLGGDNLVLETLSQTVSVPETSAQLALSFWWLVSTEEQDHPFDFLQVDIRDERGTLLESLVQLSDGDAAVGYRQSLVPLSESYAGRTLQVTFIAQTDESGTTSFFIDDVSLVKSCAPAP